MGGDPEERLEQFRDSGLVHRKRDCRVRGRRPEEVILREIRTRTDATWNQDCLGKATQGWSAERRPVSISRMLWDGVDRSLVGSSPLRGALRRLPDDVVDIFDLKK